MPKDNRERLGVLGTGMARKSGEAVNKTKKQKKKRLNDIMSQIKASRK